ncbi:S-formylglutathione hydrolase [Shewanella marina]|uniref:S-formylglutathione hydrolase n=1 Tax=Shewanella marina TaxID=487319 RepID=UPI000471F9C0|nr:S-formylglutathione hydrolase [Shewanella marina]
MNLTNISANKAFGGWHKQYTHRSTSVNCDMRFAIFIPPQAVYSPVPVLYWLSGQHCTDENFMQKSGAMKIAAELGIAIVTADTSPRGDDVPNIEDENCGLGASFYVNATQAPWCRHYHMYDYVAHELPKLIETYFPVSNKRSISGHLMGGLGAFVIALNNPQRYASISAFSPIANPAECSWGQNAFSHYLGEDSQQWLQYDACHLIGNSQQKIPALVDMGTDDCAIAKQLNADTLLAAAKKNHYPLLLNKNIEHQHDYFFITSFIEKHIKFHAEHLNT